MPAAASASEHEGEHVAAGAKGAIQLRPLADIIADLSKPVPERLLQTKTVGGRKIKFVPWPIAVKFLNLYAPGWTYEFPQMLVSQERIFMSARITIPTADCGMVWRESTGTELLSKTDYGDPSSNAESMALRRACSKFGLALDLYSEKGDKDGHSQAGNASQGARGGQSRGDGGYKRWKASEVADPMHNGNDKASGAQLGRLRGLCKDAKQDPDELLAYLWPDQRPIVDELSKNAASAAMNELEDGNVPSF